VLVGSRPQNIRRFCRQNNLTEPNLRHGRIRLVLNDVEVKRLGLRGSRLVLRYAGRWSASYRTDRPDIARRELALLFKGVGVRLAWKGRIYQEFYVALSPLDALIVRRSLPGSSRVKKSLRRRFLTTFYTQEVLIPVGVKGSLRVALVMYRPRRTATPGHIKLEIKGPVEKGRKEVLLREPSRNRMIGLLRHFLNHAGRRALQKPEQPKRWTGIPFKNKYRDGSVQKLVRSFLMTKTSREIEFERRSSRASGQHVATSVPPYVRWSASGMSRSRPVMAGFAG
jgi:hypothetical protein